MIPMKDAWDWIKTAPLPVVIAFNLMLGGYVYVSAGDSKDAKRESATAKETAKEVAASVERKLERMDTKLDALISATATLQADLIAHRQKEIAMHKLFPNIFSSPLPVPSPSVRSLPPLNPDK
jgi:hypothetical protein